MVAASLSNHGVHSMIFNLPRCIFRGNTCCFRPLCFLSPPSFPDIPSFPFRLFPFRLLSLISSVHIILSTCRNTAAGTYAAFSLHTFDIIYLFHTHEELSDTKGRRGLNESIEEIVVVVGDGGDGGESDGDMLEG